MSESVSEEDLGVFSHGCPHCNRHFCDDPIAVCKAGHNICNICRRDCFVCPVCKSEFTGKRNTKLEKSSRKRLGLDRIETQKLEYGPTNLKHNLFSGPVRDKGNFKCRVPGCNANLPICRIVNHCRSVHTSLFKQFQNNMYNCDTFTVPLEDFTKIYQSSQHGLFYIRCNVTKCENSYIIRAWAQIAASEKGSKDTRYSLQLILSKISFSFSDIPHSLRLSQEEIFKSGHYLLASMENRNEMSVMSISLKLRKNQGSKVHKNTVTDVKLIRPFGRVPV